jgi:N-acetylneuraminic acid mutarotase
MRYHSLPLAALALSSLALAGCVDEPTQPSGAVEARPTVPELAVASNTWITRANMPANRTQLATATITNAAGQSVVYAIGGLNPNRVPVTTVTAYNVATNTWTFRHTLPVPLAASNGAGVINGKIYVSGGHSDYLGVYPRNELYMYDPATNTWTRKRDIPTVLSVPGEPNSDQVAGGDGVMGVINGKLYVVSGCFEAQDPWGYFETCNPLFFRYNPATDQWTRLPSPFAKPTHAPAIGGVIAGKFYVMANSGDTYNAYFTVYDPVTNRWTPRTSLGLARRGAASAVLDGKLYVMGGTRLNAATDAFDTVRLSSVYDPVTNLWSSRASMPSARTDIAAAKVFLNGQPRIELVGGIAPGNNIQYIP